MSSVILQVGQCGNQIGEEFWKLVKENKPKKPAPVYRCGDGFFRSVHVDSEPKVLRRLVSDMTGGIREGNVISGKRGRGTNWALGYHGMKGTEDHILPQTVEMVRKEAERCDSFTGIIMMHSLCGGTGSGLGSRLCETLRDEFCLSYLMSCVVAPHVSGESPLQHYNTLLCLDSLQRHSDSVLVFHNDDTLLQVQKSARGVAAEAPVSLRQMNAHIAAGLAGVMFPVDTLTPTSGASIGLEPWEMLRIVTPMPSLKFANINTLSRSKVSWKTLAGLVSQTAVRHGPSGHPYASLGGLVVARGDRTHDFSQHRDVVSSKLKAAYNMVAWNPFPIDFWQGRLGTADGRGLASLTVCVNSSRVVDHVQAVVAGARQKQRAGAYLHWYWKHGCEQTDFEQAFETLNQVTSDYKAAIL